MNIVFRTTLTVLAYRYMYMMCLQIFMKKSDMKLAPSDTDSGYKL